MQEKCCAKGCERQSEYKKHKLCRTHYMRYRKKGTIGDKPIGVKNLIKPYQEKKDEKTITAG